MIKKGDMTISTVVYVILIILGFIIILGVFYLIYNQLSWSGVVDRTSCKESIFLRSNLPGFGGTKELVPLKCKTQKVCVTSGIFGGKCKEFEGLQGVTKLKVKNKEEIEQFIARDIVDCWQTMWEGKVSLFSQWVAESYGFGSVYPTCLICSRIAFDKETLAKSGINLDDINVMKYMMTHQIPDKKISYYSYIAGEEGKIFVKDNAEISNLQFDHEGNLITGEKINVSLDPATEKTSDKELSVLFMQISAPTHLGVIKNTALTLLGSYGATRLIAPKFINKGAAALLKSPWAWIALAIAGAYQQYSVAENRVLTASYCGDVSTGGEARDGCSVVRTVDYNIEDISKYCSVIESIP